MGADAMALAIYSADLVRREARKVKCIYLVLTT